MYVYSKVQTLRNQSERKHFLLFTLGILRKLGSKAHKSTVGTFSLATEAAVDTQSHTHRLTVGVYSSGKYFDIWNSSIVLSHLFNNMNATSKETYLVNKPWNVGVDFDVFSVCPNPVERNTQFLLLKTDTCFSVWKV